jgi:branched-chain amino acid transport system permease protein
MPEFFQFLVSGLTVGAVYALVALGFTLIYNASDVINFAQGEFVMLGGMITVFTSAAGVSLPLAALIAICVTVAVGLLLYWLAIQPARGASAFLERTVLGKAVRATAANRLAARLVGINTTTVMALAFGGSAAIGAVAGILVTPITLTSYDVGTMLALKGFAAAMLGGIGSPLGAVVGGLLLGLLEAFGAGYISSTYKDAFAFIVILVVLFAVPHGLFGRRMIERV